jgi:hypothetical protein
VFRFFFDHRGLDTTFYVESLDFPVNFQHFQHYCLSGSPRLSKTGHNLIESGIRQQVGFAVNVLGEEVDHDHAPVMLEASATVRQTMLRNDITM